LFVPCGRLSWLPVSFLLHVKYTLSYRIAYSSCWVSMSRSSNMWTKHIDAVVSKAASRLYFLKQLSQADVPTSDKPHFYTTVVRPVLEYATWIGRCILWLRPTRVGAEASILMPTTGVGSPWFHSHLVCLIVLFPIDETMTLLAACEIPNCFTQFKRVLINFVSIIIRP